MTTPDRRQALLDALDSRILVIDGAMGTMIHQEPLSIETDFLGRENCPEILAVTRPDLIKGIHRAYLEAGVVLSREKVHRSRAGLLQYAIQDGQVVAPSFAAGGRSDRHHIPPVLQATSASAW